MYFPVSFSRNFSAARRRAISFWRSVSWGAAGSGSVVAMGTSSTGAAGSAGSRTRRQRAQDGGTTSAAAWATSSARAILRLHMLQLDGVEADGGLATRFRGSSTDQSMYEADIDALNASAGLLFRQRRTV